MKGARLAILGERVIIVTGNDGPILRPKTPADVVLQDHERNLERTTVDETQKNTALPMSEVVADTPTQPVIPQ